MSWFNKNKKEDELDMSRLPELPDISEFNLQSQLPEVPPGLSNELPSLPPPPLALPSIQPPRQFSFLQKNEPATGKPLQSQKFTPSSYPVSSNFRQYSDSRKSEPAAQSELAIRGEPMEGLEMREIGGINSRIREMQEPQFEQNAPRRIEPLYVRLDKFETTMNSINEIQGKIREIESLLFRTKEIKMKEEKELEEWEKEIQGIKSRMDFIDKNVFNKLR